MVTATVVSCPPSPGGPGLAACPFPARATVGSVALSEICRSGQSRCLSTPVLPAPRRAGRCAPSVGLALDFVLSRGAAHGLPRTDDAARQGGTRLGLLRKGGQSPSSHLLLSTEPASPLPREKQVLTVGTPPHGPHVAAFLTLSRANSKNHTFILLGTLISPMDYLAL